MNPVRVGYGRTSKKNQNPELQRRDLLVANCEKLFEEQISLRKADRSELRTVLEYLREGEDLVVWKLKRFCRSLKELIELVGGLRERGVEFVSLCESSDTTIPGGQMVFHVFRAMAEFERNLNLERTLAGLEAAKQRNRHGGRPRSLDERKAKHAKRLKDEGEYSVKEIGSVLGVGRATLYGYLGGDGEGQTLKGTK